MQTNTDKLTATDTPEYPTMIDVIVEGGVIQEIIGIPEGVTVRVIDYDTEGTPDDELSISPYDSEETCIIGKW